MTDSILEFTVAGEPKPEPRHRFRGGRAHPDGRADDWKVAVRLAALAARGITGLMGPRGKPIGSAPIWMPNRHKPLLVEGPVVVGMTFWVSRPLTGRGSACQYPDSKDYGDLDNLIKAVKDALGDWKHRGPLAWTDDGQVVRYNPPPSKLWCDGEHEPGCWVRVARAV